jgi:hypothetical protein
MRASSPNTGLEPPKPARRSATLRMAEASLVVLLRRTRAVGAGEAAGESDLFESAVVGETGASLGIEPVRRRPGAELPEAAAAAEAAVGEAVTADNKLCLPLESSDARDRLFWRVSVGVGVVGVADGLLPAGAEPAAESLAAAGGGLELAGAGDVVSGEIGLVRGARIVERRLLVGPEMFQLMRAVFNPEGGELGGSIDMRLREEPRDRLRSVSAGEPGEEPLSSAMVWSGEATARPVARAAAKRAEGEAGT